MIGNGKYDAIQAYKVKLSDTEAPTLALNYSLGPISGEEATVRQAAATVTIDGDGAGATTGPTILITLKRYDQDGTALADITYTISGAAAKVAWDGSDAAGWTAAAVTLKDAIDLLNEIPGIQAFALHAPHSFSIYNASAVVTVDMAETYIPTQPGKYLECLYRDASAVTVDGDKTAWLRIGLPEVRDAGAFKLINISGKVTGHANGTLRVYRDDIRDYGKEYNATYATEIGNKQLYVDYTLAATVAAVDEDPETALTLQGPVIVEIKSDDLSVSDVWVRIMQALL